MRAIERFTSAIGDLVAVIAALRRPAIMPCAAPTTIGPMSLAMRPCATCGTEQLPGRVHFGSPTAERPCAGSWQR